MKERIEHASFVAFHSASEITVGHSAAVTTGHLDGQDWNWGDG